MVAFVPMSNQVTFGDTEFTNVRPFRVDDRPFVVKPVSHYAPGPSAIVSSTIIAVLLHARKRKKSTQQCASSNSCSLRGNKENVRMRAHDYVLKGSTEGVKNISRIGDASFCDFARSPDVITNALRHMPGGIKVDLLGLRKSPLGDMSEFFHMNMPVIEVPGFFKLKSLATGFQSMGPSSMTIEGWEIKIKEGIGDVEEINQRLQFHQKTVLSWTENPGSVELRLKTDCEMSLDLPGFYRMTIPAPVFETVGNGVVMPGMLKIMKDATMNSMLEEYKIWAKDESYRKRTAVA